MPERVPPRRSCPGLPASSRPACVSCANWAVLSLTTPANYCYALRRLTFRDLRDQERASAAATALYQVVRRTPRAPVALLKPQRIPERQTNAFVITNETRAPQGPIWKFNAVPDAGTSPPGGSPMHPSCPEASVPNRDTSTRLWH